MKEMDCMNTNQTNNFYYVAKNGDLIGPLNWMSILSLERAGVIDGNTLAGPEGANQWLTFNELKMIVVNDDAAVPVMGNPLNNSKIGGFKRLVQSAIDKIPTEKIRSILFIFLARLGNKSFRMAVIFTSIGIIALFFVGVRNVFFSGDEDGDYTQIVEDKFITGSFVDSYISESHNVRKDITKIWDFRSNGYVTVKTASRSVIFGRPAPYPENYSSGPYEYSIIGNSIHIDDDDQTVIDFEPNGDLISPATGERMSSR